MTVGHTVSLDKVIKTMMQTVADMKIKYKETARGRWLSTSWNAEELRLTSHQLVALGTSPNWRQVRVSGAKW